MSNAKDRERLNFRDFRTLWSSVLAKIPIVEKAPVTTGRNYSETPILGLYVKGIGSISLPQTDREAGSIKGLASVYAKDPHCWKLPTSKFSIKNSLFNDFVQRAGSEAGARKKLTLNRLVLCEAGSCGSHIPTGGHVFELLLPSLYTGAQVRFSFEGKTTTLNFESSSEFSMSSMVYLQEVSHEMLPVLSGYRLSLIYKFSDYKEPPLGIKFMKTTFARLLYTWKTGAFDSAPRVMIHLLDSVFCEDGPLDVGELDEDDLTQVEYAREAARQAGIGYGIGRMKYKVSGEVVDDRTPSESRMHYRIDGTDEVDDAINRSYDIDYSRPTTVSLTLSHVSDLEGEVIEYVGSARLNEENLIRPAAFEEEEPDEQDFEGFRDMGYGLGGLPFVCMLHCLINSLPGRYHLAY